MRFYVSPESIFLDKNIIEIKDKSEIHHIRDVMRLEKGAIINVFDGKGREFSGVIDKINNVSIIIKIKDALAFKYSMPFKVTLYQAIPKKSKMDFIVEKIVELGVDRIAPIITERTVPDIKDSGQKKVERWKRIANAAAKQCGRVQLPIVSDIMDFNSALMELKEKDLVIFAALHKDAQSLKALLKGSNPKNIGVFVGPEGDFSPREILLAKGIGCRLCSLGHLVLKSETAAIYILSCLGYEYMRLLKNPTISDYND